MIISTFWKSCPLLSGISLLVFILFSCSDTPRANQPETHVPSYEELADSVASIRLNQLGDSATYAGDYRQAIAYFQQSMDSAAVEADSFPYYDSKLDLACVYDRLGELPKAISIGEPVLEAFIRSGDSSRIGRTYATLAAFYGHAGMKEQKIQATQKGFDILKQYGSEIERCAAYNQMAFTYSDEGRWKEAIPLLDTALTLMHASGEFTLVPGMYLNMGDAYRHAGNLPEGSRYLQMALQKADSSGQIHVQARAIELLSLIAETRGDHRTALDLYRNSVKLKNSILSEEKNKAVKTLEVQYQTREKEQEIQVLRAREQASEARRNLLLGILFFVLGAIGAGLLYWRERAKRSQQALLQSREQLQNFAQLLVAKNARLLELEQIADAPHPFEPVEDDDPNSGDLYNFRILTEKDWQTFKQQFEHSYPRYLHRLRMAFPDITNAEERLSLLLKINLTRSEIATMLGVSESTIKKGRARLRKRLALTEKQSLEEFLQQF